MRYGTSSSRARRPRYEKSLTMRIAITLQSLDQTWGGIGIYTQEIVPVPAGSSSRALRQGHDHALRRVPHGPERLRLEAIRQAGVARERDRAHRRPSRLDFPDDDARGVPATRALHPVRRPPVRRSTAWRAVSSFRPCTRRVAVRRWPSALAPSPKSPGTGPCSSRPPVRTISRRHSTG